MEQKLTLYNECLRLSHFYRKVVSTLPCLLNCSLNRFFRNAKCYFNFTRSFEKLVILTLPDLLKY